MSNEEWGSKAVKDADLTSEEYGKLIKAVEGTALARQNAGAMQDSSDFCIGALTVFNALNIPCPVWPLLISSGRAWFEGERIKEWIDCRTCDAEGIIQADEEEGGFTDCPDCRGQGRVFDYKKED